MSTAQSLQEVFTNSTEKNTTRAQDWTEVRVRTSVFFTATWEKNLLENDASINKLYLKLVLEDILLK